MNSLNTVKRELEEALDPRRVVRYSRVTHQRVGEISLRNLAEVINAYERLDADMRSLQSSEPENCVRLGERLHNDIMALYHEYGKNYERVFLVIMGTLLPLLEDKDKRRPQGNPDPLDPENFPRLFR